MGMDFNVDVNVKTNGKEAIDALERQLNKLKSETVKVDVQLAGDGADFAKYFSSIQKQAQSAGKSTGKSYNTALQTQIETMARTQKNAFSEPLKNITKEQQSYIDWWDKALKKQEKSFSQYDATIASNKTLSWLKNNTKAVKDYGDILTDLANKQRSSMNSEELKSYTKQVNAIKTEALMLGKTGRSFADELTNSFQRIGQFVGTYGIIQQIPNTISESVAELKEVDNILTEISKTSDLTDLQLKQLGKNSFDEASKWGKKASDYLLGIQEMSRSGYYGKQAEEMANLSVLAQAAGDMTADMSNNYLLASNAAYQYNGNIEKLNALLDGQNMITNRNSVSMQDMAEATSKVASVAAQTGIAEDQLSAMIGTIEARTKLGGNEVGNALKGIIVNLQNVSSDKIRDTLDAAGASMTEYVNGAERLRNPIDILRDLAETYNSLNESDPLKSEITTNIGQKYHANKLAALLTGWSDYEKMLVDYSQGTGSAAIEAEKSANNWSGSMNKLSNSWTELVSNFTNTDAIITSTNLLTGLTNGLDDLLSVSGGYKTLIASIGGGFLAKNGLGKRNADLYKIKQNYRRFINVERFLASNKNKPYSYNY